MKIEELEKLLRLVAETGVQSFDYEENGVKISIQGKKTEPVQVIQAVQPVSLPTGMETMQMTGMPQIIPAPQAGEDKNVPSDGSKEIQSPLVGVFYAAPAEDAEPFVKVGDQVRAGQTIAIVEAMKLMNEIEAETDGVVKEILVKNGQAVEFGQPLFRIMPA